MYFGCSGCTDQPATCSMHRTGVNIGNGESLKAVEILSFWPPGQCMPSDCHRVCTKFGVDSSSRFPFRSGCTNLS